MTDQNNLFVVLPPELGKKFDGNKAPVYEGFELYFPRAIVAVANVSRYGKEKYKVPYADQNWRRVDDGRARYRNARGRHNLGELIEGYWDRESKLLHAAHLAWNAMAYLETLLTEGVSEVDVREPDARGESEATNRCAPQDVSGVLPQASTERHGGPGFGLPRVSHGTLPWDRSEGPGQKT